MEFNKKEKERTKEEKGNGNKRKEKGNKLKKKKNDQLINKIISHHKMTDAQTILE